MNYRNSQAGPHLAEIATISSFNWPEFTADIGYATSPSTSPTNSQSSHTLSMERAPSRQSVFYNSSNSAINIQNTFKKQQQRIKMISKLEDTLLRCNTASTVRENIFRHLDDNESMRQLRGVSRVMHDLVDHHPTRMFRNLYVRAPFNEKDNLNSLEMLAPFCQHLTITIGERKTKSGPISAWSKSRGAFNRSSIMAKRRESRADISLTMDDSRLSMNPTSKTLDQRLTQDIAHNQWLRIFSRTRHLRTLTVRVDGEPTWQGRTEIEDTLTTIRTALEQSADTLPVLREVRFAPVHAMGIIHLRWAGLNRFTTAGGPGNYMPSMPLIPKLSTVWQNLHTLDLQIRNPVASSKDPLSGAQRTMFLKILHDYLRGFNGTLKKLRFVWLDADGPSPLTLHLEEGLEHRSPGLWPLLEEVWLGNTTHPHRTIRMLPDLAPACHTLHTLRRSTSTSSSDSAAAVGEAVDTRDEHNWVEVLIGNRNSDMAKLWTLMNAQSSLYDRSAIAIPSSPPPGYSSLPLLTPDGSPDASPERTPPMTPRSMPGTPPAKSGKGWSWGGGSPSPSRPGTIRTWSDRSVSRSSRVVPFMLDLGGKARGRLSRVESQGEVGAFEAF